MVEQQLVDYISRHLKKGIAISKIKKELLKAGHSVSVIEEASSQALLEEPNLVSRYSLMKYVYIALIMFIVIVGLTLVIYYWPDSGASERIEQSNEQISSTTTVEEPIQNKSISENIALLKLAKEEGDLKFCEEITDDIFYFACRDKVWENNDCLYEQFVGMNVSKCWENKALDTSNVDFCSFTNNLVGCMNAIALKTNNYSSCGSSSCFLNFAIKNNDYKICKENGCLWNYIMKTNSEQLCDELELYEFDENNPGAEKQPFWECELAFKTDSSDIFDIFDNVKNDLVLDNKDQLKLVIPVAVKKSNLQVCNYLSGLTVDESKTFLDSVSAKDLCIFAVAFETNNVGACSGLTNSKDVALCESFIKSGCDKKNNFDFCHYLGAVELEE